mmetsp:Transcript_12174/g.35322  ORF Transcript_12174/g.35322 Transcript_12174/m.35322 type:complete len:231 (-) Transcript_12174:946-1638(-)
MPSALTVGCGGSPQDVSNAPRSRLHSPATAVSRCKNEPNLPNTDRDIPMPPGLAPFSKPRRVSSRKFPRYSAAQTEGCNRERWTGEPRRECQSATTTHCSRGNRSYTRMHQSPCRHPKEHGLRHRVVPKKKTLQESFEAHDRIHRRRRRYSRQSNSSTTCNCGQQDLRFLERSMRNRKSRVRAFQHRKIIVYFNGIQRREHRRSFRNSSRTSILVVALVLFPAGWQDQLQ